MEIEQTKTVETDCTRLYKKFELNTFLKHLMHEKIDWRHHSSYAPLPFCQKKWQRIWGRFFASPALKTMVFG